MLLQCVSGTKADEQEGSTAQRGFLVVFLTVDGKARGNEAAILYLEFVVLVKSIPCDSSVVVLVADLTVLEEAALGD